MFYYFYYLIAAILYIVALPIIFLLQFKQKYKTSIPARFFLTNNSPLKENGIHFHVCSYGEAKSIKAIVDNLNIDKLRFTSITSTGYSVIKEYSKDSRYLPFEIFLPFWLKKQKALVVIEAELWYMLFKSYKKRGVKTFLLNARVSEKSYPKYLYFKWLYRQIFKNIDYIYAQTKEDALRLEKLGAKDIKVIGNIKFANISKATKNFPKNKDVIVTAASTHEGEEELIFNSFLELKKIEDAQLVVVPRHPERFEKVATYLEKEALRKKLSFSRYSQSREFNTDIVLIDIMGELINTYAISDVVILGGAFVDAGGHNAAEAAQFGCKIISGENYYNQVELFSLIDGITIIKADELSQKLLDFRALDNCHTNAVCYLDGLLEELKSVL